MVRVLVVLVVVATAVVAFLEAAEALAGVVVVGLVLGRALGLTTGEGGDAQAG
jgi:hypothetical protein